MEYVCNIRAYRNVRARTRHAEANVRCCCLWLLLLSLSPSSLSFWVALPDITWKGDERRPCNVISRMLKPTARDVQSNEQYRHLVYGIYSVLHNKYKRKKRVFFLQICGFGRAYPTHHHHTQRHPVEMTTAYYHRFCFSTRNRRSYMLHCADGSTLVQVTIVGGQCVGQTHMPLTDNTAEIW